MKNKSQIIEFERKWALPAGILGVAGIAIFAAGFLYITGKFPKADGAATFLVKVHTNHGGFVMASIASGIGLAMLGGPLVYLFKACAARSDRVITALIGFMIIGPLFLGISQISNMYTTVSASNTYNSDSASRIDQCLADKRADLKSGDSAPADSNSSKDSKSADSKTADPTGSEAATGRSTADDRQDCEDDVATNLQRDENAGGTSLTLFLIGVIGFSIAVVYASLWAMRVGLLSRFWGSLGIALGVVSILFLPFTMLWFIYVCVVIVGWIPRGRPPAWAAAEAMPWLVPGRDTDEDDDDVIDGTGEPVDNGDLGARESDSEAKATVERIKRKKRRQPPPE